MHKKIFSIVAVLMAATGIVFLLSGCSKQDRSSGAKESQKEENQEEKAEKVKVYYFHNTKRCASCTTLEKYTRETIEEFFQPELRDGKVEFETLNVDKKENEEIARKYQAAGSSLFINKIIDGKDNIEQETAVWRLLSDEKKFKKYLTNKIKTSLK
ncbi:MAG: nitrophenyl compound nitroreductase subunit ArsF family protein [Candidatus Moraniibacteriota bacterium]